MPRRSPASFTRLGQLPLAAGEAQPLGAGGRRLRQVLAVAAVLTPADTEKLTTGCGRKLAGLQRPPARR